jgi:hypothetical protein
VFIMPHASHKTLGAAPTSSAQLGYSITPVVVATSNTGGTLTLATTGTLPYGIWLVIGYVNMGGATASSGQAYIWIGDNTNVYTSKKVASESYLTATNFYSSTISYVGTGTGPFLLVGQLNATGGSFGGTLYCTRIG